MLRCSHATSTTRAGDARIRAAACRFPSCVCVSCSGCRGNASFSLTYFNVWRYVAVFAAVGAGASDAKLTFVRPEKGSNNNDWGFSVEWGGASHESGERVEVPFVDLAGFVHHHVGRRAADQRVLMKMDIEGVEYLVLPSLLKTGASRSLDVLTLEKHRAKKVCPLHFLDVVVSHAQCKAMGRAWKSQFEGRGTRLLYLDDESYASDEAKPLPE